VSDFVYCNLFLTLFVIFGELNMWSAPFHRYSRTYLPKWWYIASLLYQYYVGHYLL